MRASLRGLASPALLVLLAACSADEGPAVEPAHLAAYGATPIPAGLRFANPAHRLRADLTPDGVAVTSASGAAWAFHASASRFGCEGELHAVASAAPEAHGDRVEYARGALREWYVNGPLGLEQGFTLPAPPPCARRARVEIALGGGLDAVVSGDGQEARLHDASGREALRYTDLHVIDAAGRRLPAELAPRPGGLSILLDDAGAVYPVVVDPLIWAQQDELTGDAGPGTFFGDAVSVSGDTILVGANEQGISGLGAAYVYTLSNGAWAQQQELVAVDAMPGDFFGASVSLSGDTAIVGAPGSQANQGAAYVFVRSGASWSLQQELTPSDGSQSSVAGTAVAIDGDTAVVGAPNTLSSELGAVYVFTRSAGVWTQQQIVAGDAAPGDIPGTSVAVSGDTIVFGAPGHVFGQGAAYVFVLSNGAWLQQQELTAFDGVQDDQFGKSVAVSGDTAVVGAPQRELGQAGLAYIFTRAGTTWGEPLELAPDMPPQGFGNSVALSGDALVVGWLEAGLMPAGVAYAFDRTGSTWASHELVPGDSMPGDTFGFSVAVDGTTAVVGNGNVAAYVFGLGLADGDACTSAASCASGLCTDGVCCVMAACPAPNDCQTATFCQAGTGTCQATAKPDGLACDDADACTSPDTCLGGACIGNNPKTCLPVDECHDFGACDPLSGECSTPAKADGMSCTGGVCTGGVCVPAGSGSGAGPVKEASHGCGCDVVGAPPGSALALGVGFLLMARRRRGARAR